ncbi:hypothetical protein BDM02DRAFT_3130401 [Thelephora ganbajun]|uniref:Uncharacterized protein n=1 Tax=Thelephora ganbajun TaxID=370292 RepID=A0ACB6ZA31_THEGA|nr:hypothetical protein BDM02DRAFT_3130401 [Thelephora ganbajun]
MNFHNPTQRSGYRSFRHPRVFCNRFFGKQLRRWDIRLSPRDNGIFRNLDFKLSRDNENMHIPKFTREAKLGFGGDEGTKPFTFTYGEVTPHEPSPDDPRPPHAESLRLKKADPAVNVSWPGSDIVAENDFFNNYTLFQRLVQRWLYDHAGILHRDLSPNNTMDRTIKEKNEAVLGEEKVCGVLTDSRSCIVGDFSGMRLHHDLAVKDQKPFIYDPQATRRDECSPPA